MICIDSSAIVAIVRDEPERARFVRVIDQANGSAMSAANYLEATMVCEGSVTAPGRVLFDSEMAALRQLGQSLARNRALQTGHQQHQEGGNSK